MTPLRLALLTVAAVALGLLLPSPVRAEHPTSCEWEYGGVAEVHPAKCDQPVAVTNWPDTQTVSVANQPASYPVTNVAGERLDVNAMCEPDVPCVANGNATEVFVTNTDTDPVPAMAMNPSLSEPSLVALGIAVGLGVAVLVGRVVFQRSLR